MRRAAVIVTILLTGCIALGQSGSDKQIAARYAPIFYQGIGDTPRGDYITKFDFDGDWNGANNWANAENKAYKLNAYIYYSVAETTTHYFIVYAVFHARDYKGGSQKGVILSELLRQGAKIADEHGQKGTVLDEAALAHENDMEGALVIVDKTTSKVAYIETLRHNKFSRYAAESERALADGILELGDGEHPRLYIEPKGHGIEAWTGDNDKAGNYLIYRYSGVAGDPESANDDKVGYDLLPIATTLWPKARKENTTFAVFKNYGTLSISVLSSGKAGQKKVVLGRLGSAFNGKVGGLYMARPPWGWFSMDHREDAAGLWFFDPAKVVKRDFDLGQTFSTVYVRLPFWAGKN